MPCALRIEYPGGNYHLIQQGDRREPIFKDDAGRNGKLDECIKLPGKQIEMSGKLSKVTDLFLERKCFQ